MRYVDEFRDADRARTLAAAICRRVTRPHTIMEICGGQTHAIVKYGIDALLPPEITLIHGPGCPVCVTPVETVDKAIALAGRPGVVFCSFGDMLRVPGTHTDLLAVKARGGDVRMVYSPLDAVKLAQKNPGREVVFFAIGFETTAPANALAVLQAQRLGLRNFSVLVSHVLVPPAIEAILSSGACRVQGFLAAGHVCTVMGCMPYEPIAARFGVPIVITGFEPVDILRGIERCVALLEDGRAVVENAYARSVRYDGNTNARAAIEKVFTVADQKWRGLGVISNSGLRVNGACAQFDAECRFDLSQVVSEESTVCIAGQVLQGLKKPNECPAFARECVPDSPLGAPMVSSEGACAAYFRYRRTGAEASR